MKQDKPSFKWRHFEPSRILLCVRWYCRYQLSYRDVAEMMRERGLEVNHSTVFRWVQRYAPDINKRIRQPRFKSFHTAERTLEGIEAMHMMSKGQVKRLAGSDAQGQSTCVASLFGIAAYQKGLDALPRLKIIFATQPLAGYIRLF